MLWTCEESNKKDERVGGRVDQAERELAVQNRGQGGVGRAVPGGRHGDCANAKLGFNELVILIMNVIEMVLVLYTLAI